LLSSPAFRRKSKKLSLGLPRFKPPFQVIPVKSDPYLRRPFLWSPGIGLAAMQELRSRTPSFEINLNSIDQKIH
jgi:hypothetical protein